MQRLQSSTATLRGLLRLWRGGSTAEGPYGLMATARTSTKIAFPHCRMNVGPDLVLRGQCGLCGHRRVFTGFASAGDLARASYADTLDDQGRGYQRRMSREHSLEFKRYIQQPGATSIPLTFNVRQDFAARWSLTEPRG